jgi:NAD(P)-dependent dehydrogenase (short-subunit alcohol dehydrogenase family)
MADRAAIVTGGSSGIGLAIARMLGEEGHALTVAARRPEKLDAAVAGLRDEGFEVNSVAGNLGDEAMVREVVRSHRERFGRLDVLVNSAGVGIGATVDEIDAKKVDLQLAINCARWSSSTASGQRCCAPPAPSTAARWSSTCHVKPEDLIQVSDIAETARVLLKMSPGCVVPEVQFLRAGESL